RGKLQQADGGTLFLDEIGDMPLALQTRLLRVLEERRVVPLGGEPEDVDVRLISATHRDLAGLVADGRFREDLYYRLNGMVVSLPPLRERSDREELLDYLLAEEAR
ncbi:sigma 54-interacting transcriptional regulator, partial [Pseudomonas aeruginosa]